MNELKYGFYSGITFSACVLLAYALGLHNERINIGRYAEMVNGLIPWIFIYKGMSNRKMLQGRKITFGQGVRSGIIISLVSSIIIATFLYVYVNYINTNYCETKLNFLEQQLISKHLPADEIKKEMDASRKMYSGTAGAHFSLMVFFTSVGIVVSAVISLFLRTKTPPPPSAN